MARTNDFISSFYKKEVGDYLIRQLLVKYPELNYTQAKRIFIYTYNMLGGTNGKKNFAEQREVANYKIKRK